MWDSTAAEPPVLGPINKTIKVCGIPHLAKNERDMGHPSFVEGTEVIKNRRPWKGQKG
jgi:hypothetical protein